MSILSGAAVMSRRSRYRKEEPQEMLAYKKQMKDRKDPVKSRKPEPPIKQGTSHDSW